METTAIATQGPAQQAGGRAVRIVGLGDPVMDVVVPISPDFLSTITQHPGGCLPVDGAEMETLLRSCTQAHEPLR